MLLLNLKRFVKSPVFLLGTLAYLIILYMMQPVHAATGIEDISNATLTTQAFSFFYFLVISYEFFYQVKSRHLEEIVAVSRMGLLREKLYGLLIFTIFDVILYAVYLTVSMVGTTSVLKTVNYDWLVMLVKAYLIYHFLTYLFAILLGMLVSMIQSRIKGFFALVLSYSLFSGIVYPIIMECVNFSERWTHIADIFGIMNRNYYIYCDLIYNYTTEAVNLQRILFWLFLTISILLLVAMRKNKKLFVTVSFAVTCVTFALYSRPSGERYVYGDWGIYMDEQQYYGLLYSPPGLQHYISAKEYGGIGRKYKASDYKITKYEGNLSPGRVLKASLDVSVDKPGLDEYCFTLYHGYVIKRITDEKGERLDFTQDIDHVLVKTNALHNIKKIHFEYEGYSRKYVSTYQAVFLAGNFPYLPNSGWNEYMIEPVGNEWEVGHNLKGAMYPADYDILMDTKLPVFSNLKKGKDGHFVGRSKGATFVASPFVKEMKLKNCTVYYPLLSTPYWSANIEETKKQYETAVDSIGRYRKDKKNLPAIFDLASVMDPDISWYIADEHVIASASELQELYEYYSKSGCTIDHTKWEQEGSE